MTQESSTTVDDIGVSRQSMLPEQFKAPYRWVILTLTMLVMTTSFTVRFAWSAAAVKVGDEMAFDATTLGSFVTAFFTGYVITNAVSGYFADRFGAKFMICAGLIPLAVFVSTFGLMGSAPLGLAIQVGMGLTAGINYSSCVKLIASWFGSRERGLALGVLISSSSVSVIISNALFPPFIELTSWRMLYYCLGAEVILVAALSFVGLRNGPGAASAVKPLQEPFFVTVKTFLSDRNYRLLAVVEFCGLWATWGVAFWTTALMVKGHGLSNVAAGQVTAIVGVGGLMAKPLYGWLSDILPVKRKHILAPSLVVLSIVLLIFGQMTAEAHFRYFAIILGIFVFGFTPLMSAILTEIVDPKKVGAAAGLMNSLVQFSAVLSPLTVGIIYDHTQSFMAAFGCLACGPLVAAATVLMIDEPEKGARHD